MYYYNIIKNTVQRSGEKLKKKVFITIIIFIVIVVGAVFALKQYISPSQQLSMDHTPINIEQKIKAMVTTLKSEVRLSEEDIDSLIKQHMDQQLNGYTYINGAKFYVENNILDAVLNVTLYNKVEAEVHASYNVHWNGSQLELLPQLLSVKDIPLPTSWLEKIVIPINDEADSIVTISSLSNVGKEIVIKFKLNLFSW